MVVNQLVMGLKDDETQKRVLLCKDKDFKFDFVEKLVMNKACSKAMLKDSQVNDLILRDLRYTNH